MMVRIKKKHYLSHYHSFFFSVINKNNENFNFWESFTTNGWDGGGGGPHCNKNFPIIKALDLSKSGSINQGLMVPFP